MNQSSVTVYRHEWRDTQAKDAWRIVITTNNLNSYAAIVLRPKGERLTEMEARTIWKNERTAFRLLESVRHDEPTELVRPTKLRQLRDDIEAMLLNGLDMMAGDKHVRTDTGRVAYLTYPEIRDLMRERANNIAQALCDRLGDA